MSLVRDKTLEDFKAYLRAGRLKRPDGEPCYSSRECRFYDVEATLTGRFFAQNERVLKSGAVSVEGYGHLGCCHLFVIEQVSDVVAARTGVPAGGRFQCSATEWNLTPEEVRQFAGSCSSPDECQARRRRAFMQVVQRVGDEIEPEGADVDAMVDMTRKPPQFVSEWASPDLGRTYKIESDILNTETYEPPQGARMVLLRKVCEPESVITAPLPSSARVRCKDHKWSHDVKRSDAKKLAKFVAAGHQPWRLDDTETVGQQALDSAAQSWGVVFSPDLRFDQCTDAGTVEDSWQYCTWSTPDGMQSASVDLTKFGYLKKKGGWQEVPWVATRAEAIVCGAELP